AFGPLAPGAVDARASGSRGALDRPLSQADLRRPSDSVREHRPVSRRKDPDAAGPGPQGQGHGDQVGGPGGAAAVTVKGTDWFLLSPELFLTSAGLLLLVLAALFKKGQDEFVGFLAFLSIGVTAVLLALVSAHPARQSGPILAGMFVVDNFAVFF